MENRNIIIIAKSAKHGAYCVAGIDLASSKLVRLVSNDKTTMYALTSDMIRYNDNKECEVLDVVKVRVISEKPLEIQRENILIDTLTPFQYVRKARPMEILLHGCVVPSIFGGLSQFIESREEAIAIGYSLIMVKVKDIVLSESSSHKLKVSFKYRNQYCYNWSMTDPEFFYHPLGFLADRGMIVVSIPEDDFQGKYYKFVAKILI